MILGGQVDRSPNINLPNLKLGSPYSLESLEDAGEVDAGGTRRRKKVNHPHHVLVSTNLLRNVVAEVDNVLRPLIMSSGRGDPAARSGSISQPQPGSAQEEEEMRLAHLAYMKPLAR